MNNNQHSANVSSNSINTSHSGAFVNHKNIHGGGISQINHGSNGAGN